MTIAIRAYSNCHTPVSQLQAGVKRCHQALPKTVQRRSQLATMVAPCGVSTLSG